MDWFGVICKFAFQLITYLVITHLFYQLTSYTLSCQLALLHSSSDSRDRFMVSHASPVFVSYNKLVRCDVLSVRVMFCLLCRSGWWWWWWWWPWWGSTSTRWWSNERSVCQLLSCLYYSLSKLGLVLNYRTDSACCPRIANLRLLQFYWVAFRLLLI